MVKQTLTQRRLKGRAMFFGLGLFIIFTHLIPLDTVPPSLGGTSLQPITQPRATTETAAETAPGTEIEVLFDPVRWLGPDLLVLLALAWVTRRPSFAPAIVIGAIFLLADMLFHRPPGLWTALVLIASEILRSRSRAMRALPFWLEWATVGAGLTTITALYHFTLSMVLAPQGALGLTLVQLALTIACYPVVVFVSYAVFGVSRPAPGEVDALGHRI